MGKYSNDGNVTRAAIEGAAGGAVTGTVLAMMGPLTGPRKIFYVNFVFAAFLLFHF